MIRHVLLILIAFSLAACKQYSDHIGASSPTGSVNKKDESNQDDYDYSQLPPHSFGEIPEPPPKPAARSSPPSSNSSTTTTESPADQGKVVPTPGSPTNSKTPTTSTTISDVAQEPSPVPVPAPLPVPLPRVPKEDVPPATPKVPGPKEGESSESGMLVPTVYYLPVFDNDSATCPVDKKMSNNVKVKVFGLKGELLGEICKSFYNDCALQGSCVIVEKNQRTRLSAVAKRGGVTYFRIVDESLCPHGETGRGICVDPFFSVAADLSIYKLGDVFFVPSLVNLVLPSGLKHDGYFIVRDTGSAIRGRGRFDFYTGYFRPDDEKNPFLKIQLNDKNTRLPYYKVSNEIANKVRQSRNYPRLPEGTSIAGQQ